MLSLAATFKMIRFGKIGVLVCRRRETLRDALYVHRPIKNTNCLWFEEKAENAVSA